MKRAITSRRGLAFRPGKVHMFVHNGYPVADMKWVGVIRMAPSGQGKEFCDGYCPGFGNEPFTSQLAYQKISPVAWTQSINYGCWFYMAPNASAHSEAAVNVGKSIRFNTRCDAHTFFYNSSQSANALCTHNPGDRFWCTFAFVLGYDSIQIKRGIAYYKNSLRRKPWSELIMCNSPCNTTRFAENACVPFARPVKNNTLQSYMKCRCPPNAVQLSCARNFSDYLPVHV